ncbi:AAA family ATPase [Saccharopolyspora sp. 5N102]|uniref:AAA family ATPase n=1 Tax=Saccharopolyspora sp. 5N102 TaxID=3375155 RepID=UPI0037AB34E0
MSRAWPPPSPAAVALGSRFPGRLHGRTGESAAIEQLVADARPGHSGVLILRGEAGIGKSALLEHARTVAADLRVLRGYGIESESELPFAGLHLLLCEHLDGIDRLPAQQASALRFHGENAREPRPPDASAARPGFRRPAGSASTRSSDGGGHDVGIAGYDITQ